MMDPEPLELRAHEVVARLGASRRAAQGLSAATPAWATPPPRWRPADIDLALVQRLLAAEGAGDRLTKLVPQGAPAFAPIVLPLRGEGAQGQAEREWAGAEEIRSAMDAAVPQSLLRDLHRPVPEIAATYEVDEALREALRPCEFTAADVMAERWRAAPSPSPWQLPQDVADVLQWFASGSWATIGKDRR